VRHDEAIQRLGRERRADRWIEPGLPRRNDRDFLAARVPWGKRVIEARGERRLIVRQEDSRIDASIGIENHAPSATLPLGRHTHDHALGRCL